MLVSQCVYLIKIIHIPGQLIEAVIGGIATTIGNTGEVIIEWRTLITIVNQSVSIAIIVGFTISEHDNEVVLALKFNWAEISTIIIRVENRTNIGGYRCITEMYMFAAIIKHGFIQGFRQRCGAGISETVYTGFKPGAGGAVDFLHGLDKAAAKTAAACVITHQSSVDARCTVDNIFENLLDNFQTCESDGIACSIYEVNIISGVNSISAAACRPTDRIICVASPGAAVIFIRRPEICGVNAITMYTIVGFTFYNIIMIP